MIGFYFLKAYIKTRFHSFKRDKIEMFQFRRSPVLKELFHVSLKRPSVRSARHKAQAFNGDGRVLSKINPVFAADSVSYTSAWRRRLCTKAEGAIEASEPVKNDGTVQETATDK